MASRPKREVKQTNFFTTRSEGENHKSSGVKGNKKLPVKASSRNENKNSNIESDDEMNSSKPVPSSVSDEDEDEDEEGVEDEENRHVPESDDDEMFVTAAKKSEGKSKSKGKNQKGRSLHARAGRAIASDSEAEANVESDESDDELFARKKPKTAAAVYKHKTTAVPEVQTKKGTGKVKGKGNTVLKNKTDDEDDEEGAEHDEDEFPESSKRSGKGKFRGTSASASAKGWVLPVFNKADSMGNDLYGMFLETVVNKEPVLVRHLVTRLGSNHTTTETEIVNFVLLSAGAPKNCIPPNTDLDGLNPDEVYELFEEHVEKFKSAYPLHAFKGKSKTKHFRVRFASLFLALSSALLHSIVSNSQDSKSKASSYSSEGSKHLTALQVIIDQLVGLSASQITSIRDTATEAVMAFGHGLVTSGVTRATELATLKRLLSAEVKNKKKGSGTSARGVNASANAKEQQLSRSVSNLETLSKLLDNLTSTIFTGVLVLRYKDTVPAIRSRCMNDFGIWLSTDPKRYFKDEYLKYIGWMMTDPVGTVRQSAIEALLRVVRCADVVPVLTRFTPFVERFAETMASLAALDVDDGVRKEALQLFIILEQHGLLDTVDQDVLDRVDSIVFDVDSTEECRCQALTFMMNHTEGFEAEEQEDDEDEDGDEGADTGDAENLDVDMDVTSSSSSSRSKATKGGHGNSSTKQGGGAHTAQDAHKRRQKAAVQLETLCEFVVLHLEEPEYWPGSIPLLVKAFSQVADSRRNIVRDWSSIVSLLLKESDDLVSSSLRPALVNVLLHIFVASVDLLRSEISTTTVPFAATANSDSTYTAKESKDQAVLLAEVLRKDLNKLITRSRDEPDHIALLCRLFESASTGVGTSTGGHKGKGLKLLVKQVTSLFESSQRSDVLETTVGVLRTWKLEADTGTITDIDAALSVMTTDVWKKISTHVTDLRTLLSDSASASNASTSTAVTDIVSKSKAKSKGKGKISGDKSTSSDNQIAIRDAVYGLSSSITKLMTLSKAISLGDYCDFTSVNVYDLLEEVTELAVKALTLTSVGGSVIASQITQIDLSSQLSVLPSTALITGGSGGSTAISKLLAQTCADACDAMFAHILWAWHDLSSTVRQKMQTAEIEKPSMRNTRIAPAKRARGGKAAAVTAADVAGSGSGSADSDSDIDMNGTTGVQYGGEGDDMRLSLPTPAAAPLFDEDELDHFDNCVDAIDSMRTRLTDILVTWMSIGADARERSKSSTGTGNDTSNHMDTEDATSADIIPITPALAEIQRHAFRTINDLRALFPPRLEDVNIRAFARLAYKPSQEVFKALRTVFEKEGRSLAALTERMESGYDVDDINAGLQFPQSQSQSSDTPASVAQNQGHLMKLAQEQQSEVLRSILASLSSSLLGDMSHLNRRQAAAVISYFSDGDTKVVDVVRALGKKLKASGIVRYLEVQMIALKNMYSENVATPLQHLTHLELTGESQLSAVVAVDASADVETVDAVATEPLEEGDYLRLIKAGCNKVEALATRMAQSLGVTADQFAKQEGESGREALSSFVNVGLHWALQESPVNALFLDSLQKYVRFLKADQLKAVRSTARLLLEDSTLFDLMTRYEAFQQGKEEVDLDAAEQLRAGALFGFLTAVGHKTKTTSRATGADVGDADMSGINKSIYNRSANSNRKSVSSSRDMEILLQLHGERVPSARHKAASKRLSKKQRAPSTGTGTGIAVVSGTRTTSRLNASRKSMRDEDSGDSAIEEEEEEEEEQQQAQEQEQSSDDDDLFASQSVPRSRARAPISSLPTAAKGMGKSIRSSSQASSKPALSLALEDMHSTHSNSSQRSSSVTQSLEEEAEEEEEELMEGFRSSRQPAGAGASRGTSVSAASGGLPSSRRFRHVA